MKKVVILSVAMSMVLAGCGDEPQPVKEEYTSAQKFELEMQEKQFEHELEMHRIQLEQQKVVHAEPTPSGYIEEDTGYYGEPEPVYREAPVRQGYSDSVYEPVDEGEYRPDVMRDDGYSGGSVLASGAMGLASGYLAAKVLDDGWRSTTDSSGNVSYFDANNRSVSASQYKEHSKTHKVVKSFDKAKDKTKQLANKGAAKAKQLADKTKPHLNKAKLKAKEAYAKASPKAKQKMLAAKDKAKKAWNKATPATKAKFKQAKEKYKKASPEVKKQMRVKAKQFVRKAKNTARKAK